VKNLTWQNPEQLFVAQELIKIVKLKCCGIKVYRKQENLKNIKGKVTFLRFWEGKEEGFFQIVTKWAKSLMASTFFLQFKAFGRLNANCKSFPENKYHKYHKCSQFMR